MSKISVSLDKLRDLPDEELREALASTQDELFRLRLGQYTNQVTSTAALTTKRREIARIMTILRARQLGNETQQQKTAEATGESTEAAAPVKKTRKAKAKS